MIPADLEKLFQRPDVDPFAIGSVLATNPEAIVPTLVAQGVAPPKPLGSEYGVAPQAGVGQGPTSWAPHDMLKGMLGIGQASATEPMQPTPNLPGYGSDYMTGSGAMPAPTTPAPAPAPVPASSPTAAAPSVPMPRPRPAEAPAAAPAPAASPAPDLAKMLAGVKAPANPEFQRITSPRLPDARAIPQPTAIMQLLQQMSGGANPAQALRLEQALGRR